MIYRTRTQWFNAGFQVPKNASPVADFVDGTAKVPAFSRDQVVDLTSHQIVLRPIRERPAPSDHDDECIPGI